MEEALAIVCLLLAVACTPVAADAPEAGVPEAGVLDAGPPDAVGSDAGVPDDGSSNPGLDSPRAPTGCDRDDPFDPSALLAEVEYLAHPAFDGRVPGTAGDRAAQDFVADRFECLGLGTAGAPGRGYRQPFVDAEGRATANVLAVVPGRDPEVGHEVVVVSAHLDHFGEGKLGANDDASGLVGLLAIAQELTVQPVGPRRTVLFAAFGSEEDGFEGSEVFVTAPTAEFDPGHFVFDLNLDMIGSYAETDTVYALGAQSGTVVRDVVRRLSAGHSELDVSLDAGSDQSDNATFCQRGVPYLFLWTEDERCYHQTCDTAERIDAHHMGEIARLAALVLRELADTDTDLAGEVLPGTDVCRAEE